MVDQWRRKMDLAPGLFRMTAPITAEDVGENYVFQIEAGSLVLAAWLVVTEPFVGGGKAPVLTMGDGEDRQRWIAAGDADLHKAGLYGQGVGLGTGRLCEQLQRIYLTLEPHGELTAGCAYGLLWIVKLDVGG